MIEIRIRYLNGRVNVNLEKFFPAKQGDVKKLLKVIAMDRSEAMHLQFIRKWLEKEIGLCDSNSRSRKEKLQKNLGVLQ